MLNDLMIFRKLSFLLDFAADVAVERRWKKNGSKVRHCMWFYSTKKNEAKFFIGFHPAFKIFAVEERHRIKQTLSLQLSLSSGSLTGSVPSS